MTQCRFKMEVFFENDINFFSIRSILLNKYSYNLWYSLFSLIRTVTNLTQLRFCPEGWVRKLIKRDSSVCSSSGEILNFLKPKNGIKFNWSMPWNILCDLNLKALMHFLKIPLFWLKLRTGRHIKYAYRLQYFVFAKSF
jgi:hypothetical protein